MFIIYNTAGTAVRKVDHEPDIRVPHFCVEFRDWQTRDAAWIADATALQAIEAFGGINVDAREIAA